MNMERMWDMASTISAIAGLFVSAILVARFYVPYMIKKKSAVRLSSKVCNFFDFFGGQYKLTTILYRRL